MFTRSLRRAHPFSTDHCAPASRLCGLDRAGNLVDDNTIEASGVFARDQILAYVPQNLVGIAIEWIAVATTSGASDVQCITPVKPQSRHARGKRFNQGFDLIETANFSGNKSCEREFFRAHHSPEIAGAWQASKQTFSICD